MEGKEDAPIKEKKPRTPAQVEAFKRAQDIRIDDAKIKKEHTEAIKTEKVLQLIAKQKKTKEIQDKKSAYHSEEEESEKEEPKPEAKSKAKAKPKRKKIAYETESSTEEEEIVYVKRSKSRAKTRPKKKIVNESESEEEKPQQSNLQQNVAKSSNDQLKYDLHNERIHSALRSLGYIA